MCRNSANVEHEMICHTVKHCGDGNCSKSLKISGNNTRTTLNRLPTKNCHTRNITHHKEIIITIISYSEINQVSGHGQSYRTPCGAVINEYRAMVEWLQGKTEEL
jgi:hypothetical protein